MPQEQDRLEHPAVAMETESLYSSQPRHGDNMLLSTWEKSQGHCRTTVGSWDSIMSQPQTDRSSKLTGQFSKLFSCHVPTSNDP